MSLRVTQLFKVGVSVYGVAKMMGVVMCVKDPTSRVDSLRKVSC
jgi:hypothetical protein